MALIEIYAYEAEPTTWGSITLSLHMGGRPDHVPASVRLEVKTTAQAVEAFNNIKNEWKQLGQPLGISMRLAQGRRPAGFKEVESRTVYVHCDYDIYDALSRMARAQVDALGHDTKTTEAANMIRARRATFGANLVKGLKWDGSELAEGEKPLAGIEEAINATYQGPRAA